MVPGARVLTPFRGTIYGELGDSITLAGNRGFSVSYKSVVLQHQANSKENESCYLNDRFDGGNRSLDFVFANTAIRHKRRWNRVAGRTERGSIDGDSVGYAKMGMKIGFEPMQACRFVNMVEGLKFLLK
jgi:hypothetical protein